MEELLKIYKRKFNNTLSPIKAMLANRRATSMKSDWLEFVERTKSSVISHPEQYLGNDLPDKSSIIVLVNLIFDEFLQEEISV